MQQPALPAARRLPQRSGPGRSAESRARRERGRRGRAGRPPGGARALLEAERGVAPRPRPRPRGLRPSGQELGPAAGLRARSERPAAPEAPRRPWRAASRGCPHPPSRRPPSQTEGPGERGFARGPRAQEPASPAPWRDRVVVKWGVLSCGPHCDKWGAIPRGGELLLLLV